MFSVRDVPIRRKLMLMVALTSSAALALACTAFVAYEIFMFRRTMILNLSTLAEMIGANSAAAVVFNDQRSAEETLAALRAERHIMVAYIYGKNDRLFAAYSRDGGAAEAPAIAARDGYRFGARYLALWRTVVRRGGHLGTLY